MKVLILGATGIVGFPVAQAYVRAGHEVYGATRTTSNFIMLQQNEINPVIVNKAEDWAHLLDVLDIVIDASRNTGPEDVYRNLKTAADGTKHRQGHLKLTYIFTSGTWGYGNSDDWKDERNARFEAGTLVGWRPAAEEAVVSNTDINGIVIRSAMVYGRSASLYGLLFKAATDASPTKGGTGTFEWAATLGKRWATIHQDDLANLFLRVGEAAPITKHIVFDATNAASESVEDVLTQLGRLVGVKHTYRVPSTALEEAIDTQGLTRPSLGAALVGWMPKKRTLVDGLPIYFKAWEASVATA